MPEFASNPTMSLQATMDDDRGERPANDGENLQALRQHYLDLIEQASKEKELVTKEKKLATKEKKLATKDRKLVTKEKKLAMKEKELAAKELELVMRDHLRSEQQQLQNVQQRLDLQLGYTRGDPIGPSWIAELQHSVALCATLLQPLEALPDIADLQGILSTPTASPAAQLPLDNGSLHTIRASYPRLAVHFTTLSEQPSERFYIAVVSAVTAKFAFHGEQHVAQAVDRLVTDFLLLMDSLVPPMRKLGLSSHRDAGDGNSMATLLSPRGQPLRPDLQLRATDGMRLLYKGEEKTAGVDLSEAVSDLQEKTKAWTPLYYGDLPYLICHAAAGSRFQFYAIPKDTLIPEPISVAFDMSTTEGRLLLTLATIQLYRVLAAVSAALPANVLPVDKLLEHSPAGLGFKRTLLYKSDRLTVVKCVQPFSSYASVACVDFAQLQQVYAATKTAAGVVHAAAGPLLDEATDTYKVELAPLGRNQGDAQPKNGEQLRNAVQGLLKGLDALHEAGFCHRDVRWPNVACSYDRSRYYWLDLEMAAPLDGDAVALFQRTTWPEDVLVADKYTAASDLYCLGSLFDKVRFSTLDITAYGRDLLDCLKRPSRQQNKSARDLLAHRWFTQ